ncbi:MFS transporter [Rubrivivax gelatinosus]|uniref:MFS transporter n=1 Tax=Rubrivivax gelatinosus TaxID=28068 RepID=A0ABS1DW88_RUBGE|nr:MFS transporter [Rubrivivax gelatinosus]MBK1613415.1 MFS transporter [Rubrivivax gelatinosus]MBK1714291.1 MFS transporter [Rubrivivax gelatinosus]
MEKRFANPWWVVFGSIFGLIVGNGPIMQFTFGVFLKPITQEFGWERSTTSTALVVGLLGTGLCVPIAGRLMDKYGVRAVTLPSITAFALAMIALAFFANSPMAFVIIYALMGMAAAGQTPMPYSKAITAAFDDKRGLALGIAMAGVGIGAALVPQIAQYLVTNYGWRGAYVGLAALTFCLAFPAVALFVNTEPAVKHGSAGAPIARPGLTGAQALRTGKFWALAVAFFSVAMASNGTIGHIVPLLTDRGFSPQIAAGAMTFAGVALVAGRFVAGYLLDRIFAPYVATFFFVIPLGGIALLLMAPGQMTATIAVVMIGLGLGAEVDLIAYLVSRYLGMRSFGEIYGYLFMIFMLGNAVGPFLMGVSFGMGGYETCLAGFVVALVIASGLVLRLGTYAFPPERRGPPPSQGAKPAIA